MQEERFKSFLETDKNLKGKNGVTFRMSKARNAESILKMNLDIIVVDDDLMYDSLVKLQEHENPKHNPMQNALRKYYIFMNGKEFPQLRYYNR